MLARSYWRLARAPRYSLLFALPLVLLYEALGLLLSDPQGHGIRNAADVILKQMFIALAGRHGPWVFWACLAAVGVWLVVRDVRRHGGELRPAVFALMLAEAAILALLVGGVVGVLTTTLLRPLALAVPTEALDWPTKLMVSLGAGLYEELLFRVLLVSCLAWLGARVFGWHGQVAAGWAVLGGALAFSVFHYIGPFGDQPNLYSFTFRLIAGLFFSGLFVLRGFGITAWTHALYDVFLLLAIS
jgi:hypothetical protein